MQDDMTRTRFSPSPTGFLHIGGLRTALYSYALAKHNKGEFILRIEDTDRKREVPGATEALKVILKKFGLLWDEFYIQSQRQKEGIYQKKTNKLISDGHAFYCQCKPKTIQDDASFSKELRDPCREKELKSGAVKLKVPEGKRVSYFDFVHRKEISWNTSDVYDATLLKSDKFPTYHLAVVVDDLDMRITHILRGHEWLPSTPIHLLLLEYLGGKRPEIGHLSDILSGETGKKLSKRRDSVFVEQFLKDGYLQEALLNFVMLLGWAPKDNRELFTLQGFVDAFDINGLQEANPRFFKNKLDWFNGYYIRKKADRELISLLKPYAPEKAEILTIEKIVPLIKDRIKKLSDFEAFAGFFFKSKKPKASMFGKKHKDHLIKALEALEEVSNWNNENVDKTLTEAVVSNSFKTGDFFMDLRIAVTGSKFTPPINNSIVILGKDETLKRIKEVL